MTDKYIRNFIDDSGKSIPMLAKDLGDGGYAIAIDMTPPVSFGDETGSMNIAADGTVTLSGLATAYRDELYQLVGQRLESPSSDIIQSSTECAIEFKTTATTVDYVTMNIQLNHDWAGTIIQPHLHWWQTSTNIPNWLLQYRYQENGGLKVTGWTSLGRLAQVFPYTSDTLNQITTFSGITPANPSISDSLQLRLIRDTTNASGKFSGSDPLNTSVYAVSLDVHIEIDSFGSKSEYLK